MNRKVYFEMPAYNIGPFISEAIASIGAQTYRGCQVVVVDDGSTDDTAERAEIALEDPRLAGSVLLRQSHQRHVAAANAAIRECFRRGAEVIARLDGDDVQDPIRIAKQMALLEAGADIATCDMWFFDAARRWEQAPGGGMKPAHYGLNAAGDGICCGSIIAWSRVYREVGPFDPAWEWSPDSDWNFRAVRGGAYKWADVPEPLYGYRIHPGQTTRRHPGQGLAQYRQLCALHREWQAAREAAGVRS